MRATLVHCRNAVESGANTVIFVVCGMLISGRVYRAHQPGGPWLLQGTNYGYAVALWLLLLVRCANVFSRYMFLQIFVPPSAACEERIRSVQCTEPLMRRWAICAADRSCG